MFTCGCGTFSSIDDTDGDFSAPTEVIALENTLNGTIFPQEENVAISAFAHEHGIKMHLDGARIWHVAAETGVSLRTLLEPFDSVSLCFSKGLGECLGPTSRFVSQMVDESILNDRCPCWIMPRRSQGLHRPRTVVP